MRNKNIGVALVIAVIIAVVIGGWFLFAGPHNPVGGVTTCNGGNCTNFNAVETSAGYWISGLQVLDIVSGATELILGTSSGSITKLPSIGTCDTSTSTPFAVANPFSASSTAHVIVTLGSQATSSAFQVGTSTRSTGLTSATVSSGLIGATLATATPAAYLVSGVNTAYSTQTGNYEIVVGPSQYVGSFSTSTYGNAGAINYTPTSCSYKILWTL